VPVVPIIRYARPLKDCVEHRAAERCLASSLSRLWRTGSHGSKCNSVREPHSTHWPPVAFVHGLFHPGWDSAGSLHSRRTPPAFPIGPNPGSAVGLRRN
jgi:hypothetical protein